MDCTANMHAGPGQHGAQASVAAFLTEMTEQYNIPFRAGGIKLNDPYDPNSYDSPSINMDELTSIDDFTDPDRFISGWVNDGYEPYGDSGSGLDLQLDGLHFAAQDMSEPGRSTEHKYIVLVTDFIYRQGYPYCLLSQVVSELSASGCPVYISLWPPARDDYATWYTSLLVNGGSLDPVDESGYDVPGHWKYPFAALRARILQDY